MCCDRLPAEPIQQRVSFDPLYFTQRLDQAVRLISSGRFFTTIHKGKCIPIAFRRQSWDGRGFRMRAAAGCDLGKGAVLMYTTKPILRIAIIWFPPMHDAVD